MINRQATHLCRDALSDLIFNVDEYTIGTKLAGDLKQRGVNMLFNAQDMLSSLDEFSDKKLLDPVNELAEKMRQDGAFWTFDLPLPKDCASARNRYDGLSMRFIAIKADNPDAWVGRIDVLYLTKSTIN